MQPDTCPFCGNAGLQRMYGDDGNVYYIEGSDMGYSMDTYECLKCLKVFWVEPE